MKKTSVRYETYSALGIPYYVEVELTGKYRTHNVNGEITIWFECKHSKLIIDIKYPRILGVIPNIFGKPIETRTSEDVFVWVPDDELSIRDVYFNECGNGDK